MKRLDADVRAIREAGKTILLLLCGGDKRTQRRDIENAKTYFQDYKRRTEKVRPGKRAT